MKCEICKKNEAQFYYKESINGKTTEKHLCAECAHKEGLDRIFEHEANSMLTSFGKMMDSFLLPDVDFFGFGRLPSIGEMFEPLRTLSEHEPEAGMHEEADPLEAKAEEKGEEALGHKGEEPSVREDAYPLEAEAEENAEEAFEQRRELNALRHKMHKAVEEEDFETAIELRDMIRKMENK